MQHAEQKMRFGEDPHAQQKKRVGYLNPMRICKDEHTVIMGPSHGDLQGKTDEEIVSIKAKKQQDKELEVATYIGNTFLEWQRQGMRSCPIKLPVCWSLTPLTILVYKVTVLTHALIKFVQRPLDLYTGLS